MSAAPFGVAPRIVVAGAVGTLRCGAESIGAKAGAALRVELARPLIIAAAKTQAGKFRRRLARAIATPSVAALVRDLARGPGRAAWLAHAVVTCVRNHAATL